GTYLTRGHDTLVDDPTFPGGHGVDHADRAGVRPDRPSIPDLAAALRVERGALEEEPDPLPFLRRGQLGVVLAQEQRDGRLSLVLAVPDELGRRHRAGLQTDLDLLGGRAGPMPLLLEEDRESVGVDRQALVRRDLLEQLDRE